MSGKKKGKIIIIKEEDEFEGNSCIDYLISSMNEMKKKIDNIHNEISDKFEKNYKNEALTKEEENKIHADFNKMFNINENNQEKIFVYLNQINQNHINKYKKIFKFLNLNLVVENDMKKINEEKEKKDRIIKNFECEYKDIINNRKKENIENKVEEKKIIEKKEKFTINEKTNKYYNKEEEKNDEIIENINKEKIKIIEVKKLKQNKIFEKNEYRKHSVNPY